MAQILINAIVDRLREIRQSPNLRTGWRDERLDPLFSNSPYAYVAYVAGSRLYTSHKNFPNEDAFRDAFRDFGDKALERRTQIVRRWGEVLRSDAEIAEKIQRWLRLDDENQQQRRPRAHASASQPQRRPGLRPRGRRQPSVSQRVPLQEEPESGDEAQDPPASGQSSPASSLALLGDLEEANIPGWDRGRRLVNIPMKAMNWLVPARLASSVVRQDHSERPGLNVAAASLEFGSRSGQKTCRIILQICKESTARYARALFGVQLEERNGVCFIRNEQSHALIVGVPQLQLTECHRECLVDEFGKLLAGAMAQHPRYKEEDARFELFTQNVFMKLPNDLATTKAEIMLELGYEEGKSILYRLRRRDDDEYPDDDEGVEDVDEEGEPMREDDDE